MALSTKENAVRVIILRNNQRNCNSMLVYSKIPSRSGQIWAFFYSREADELERLITSLNKLLKFLSEDLYPYCKNGSLLPGKSFDIQKLFDCLDNVN